MTLDPDKTLKICPRCNYVGKEDEKVCPSCGVKLISKCPQCGARIRTPFAEYCYYCGAKFEDCANRLNHKKTKK